MHDSEIKKLLLETCPVQPGQEDRAWIALRQRLYGQPAPSRWAWFYAPTWHGALTGLALLCVIALSAELIASHSQPISFASARSEAPGIYATSFYSHAADAQVVWLNGLDPATDRPAPSTPPASDTPANL